MTDFFSVLNRRRSVRAYREAQLQEEELQTIIEAGRTAPSGGSSCSTHMLVLQNPDILEKLRVLVEQEFSKMDVDEQTYPSIRNSVNASKKGGYAFFYHAPTLIITANRIGYGNAMADTACVLENMMLAATALGVGSCWINQLRWLNENDAIRAFYPPSVWERTKSSAAVWHWAILLMKLYSKPCSAAAIPSPMCAEASPFSDCNSIFIDFEVKPWLS